MFFLLEYKTVKPVALLTKLFQRVIVPELVSSSSGLFNRILRCVAAMVCATRHDTFRLVGGGGSVFVNLINLKQTQKALVLQLHPG